MNDIAKLLKSLQNSIKKLNSTLAEINKTFSGAASEVAAETSEMASDLDNVKESADELEDALGDVAKNINLKKATKEAKDSLGGFKDKAKDATKKIKGLSEKLGDLNDKFGVTSKLSSIASTGLKGLKSVMDATVKATTAISVAMVGVGTVAVKTSDDCKGALNTLQAQTGATAEEMEGLKDTLLSIYSNNYGESFEDVAESLANVKQQTGLAGQALEDFTKNALILRDTFDMEVTESTRAADMMMRQFGVTGEEAFNLIAQGAQNGLDKNGNMLDSINEYSVHFKQLGLDAEDMFNMMSNGAQKGVFDYDKLGDAIKEFGIRAKDGSDSTKEAFSALGLDADKITQAFANGGEGAEQAFQQVNEALANCDDKVLQNQAGVALWGRC